MTNRAPEPRRFIVGYDSSAGSERALTWALDRAGARGLVLLVNAARPQPDRLHVGLSSPSEHVRLARAEALLELAFLERDDLYAEVECLADVRDAEPAAALIDAADESDADAIVVGCRDQSRLRAATGSVCTELLERSMRPLVVVP